jgi:hypothetical protein
MKRTKIIAVVFVVLMMVGALVLASCDKDECEYPCEVGGDNPVTCGYESCAGRGFVSQGAIAGTKCDCD